MLNMRSHSFRRPFATRSNEQSMRGKITTIAPALILAVLSYASPARSAETIPIKCGVNEDRVWVYDSLNSFDVSLKLKCGEPVEIIGREKGYIKIRTSTGREGYVPEKALPKLPDADGNNPVQGQAQAAAPDGPQSVAAAAHAKPSSRPALAVPKPAETASVTVNQPNPVPMPTAPARESADVASSATGASTPPVNANSSVTAANDTSAKENAKPQPIPAHSQAKPVTYTPAHSTTSSTASANTDSKTVSASQEKTKSASTNTAAPSTKVAAAKTTSSKTAPASNVSVAPAPAPAAESKTELADNLPSAPPASTGSVHAGPAPRDPDEEEMPPVKSVENNEACKIYFSAYGLSPNQYKWMTRNRNKSFPGICPAPAPSMVDFIVIFTHDADFYNGTMPTPVHTDKNGFSDFTPLTTVDTAVVSPSEADKNRREYVWVFHTKRGTFDPAKFSPKRRPLFSTTESNKLGTAAGGRSAEDALRFIEQHGADH
jgi:hypothetical protein